MVAKYTEAQVTDMIEKYQAGVPVAEIATHVGQSVRSVIAKLAAVKVYQSKAKTTTKSGRVTKMELVNRIAYNLGVSAESFANLDGVPKETLEALEAAINKVCFDK